MPMGGELAHVCPYLRDQDLRDQDLRDQDLRRPAVYSWYGIQELNFLAERGDHPLYLDTQLGDGLVKVVDVSQNPADHEAMVSGESSFQCFPQRAGIFERRRPRANSASISRDRWCR